MNIIRSPLGALGALMILLEAISGGTLAAIRGQPDLQRYLVWMMIITISVITAGVLFIIIWLAIKRPGLLFSPQDIDPSAHRELYVFGPGEKPKPEEKAPPIVSYEVVDEDKGQA